MAERSDRVIAVYDGREKGGTVRTIRFAHQMKKELREITVGEIILPGQSAAKRKLPFRNCVPTENEPINIH